MGPLAQKRATPCPRDALEGAAPGDVTPQRSPIPSRRRSLALLIHVVVSARGEPSTEGSSCCPLVRRRQRLAARPPMIGGVAWTPSVLSVRPLGLIGLRDPSRWPRLRVACG